MKISIAYSFLPKSPTANTSIVMDHFGVGMEVGQNVIAENWELPVHQGDVICFTGASGSGKSSVMRAVAAQLPDVVDINSISLPTKPLVDGLDLPTQESIALLSACGLGEAQLMLRLPSELSDGQRYRFRLAMGLAQKPRWIFADEFTATLDRTLAKVIAFNVRRHADRTGMGFLLATTHEDILPDLDPSLHVQCQLGNEPVWVRSECKKKEKALCSAKWKSQPEREQTGRISLGGITEATTSGCPVL
ncbi:MAG: ATP-binding cassette domain-containing protein [Planctomycetaceae bacterium]